MELVKIKTWGSTIANGSFLVVLNLSIITVIGYLTLDSEANLNSRIGGVLLSFFIPYFIVTKTKQSGGLDRLLKFGAGFIFYIIMSIIMAGFPTTFVSWLLPCLVLGMATLFYGNRLA
jgi:hypothetical protein